MPTSQEKRFLKIIRNDSNKLWKLSRTIILSFWIKAINLSLFIPLLRIDCRSEKIYIHPA